MSTEDAYKNYEKADKRYRDALERVNRASAAARETLKARVRANTLDTRLADEEAWEEIEAANRDLRDAKREREEAWMVYEQA